jgi:hypothetical protein
VLGRIGKLQVDGRSIEATDKEAFQSPGFAREPDRDDIELAGSGYVFVIGTEPEIRHRGNTATAGIPDRLARLFLGLIKTRAGSPPDHRFPAPGESTRTQTDTEERQFEFRWTLAEPGGTVEDMLPRRFETLRPGVKSRPPTKY